MAEKRHLRIFLSSPGDVPDERRLVHLAADRLNYDRELRERVALQVVAWDDPNAATAMLGSLPPQVAINEGLALPADCDIVLIILWSRMGTPTRVDGVDYDSGTHYEFLNAIEAAERSGGYPPVVLLYRRTQTPTFSDADIARLREKIDQYEKVQAFFNGPLFFDAQRRPLRGVNPYETPEHFERLLEMHIKQAAERLLAAPARHTRPAEPPLPLWPGSPFPGLNAFTEKDEPIYFGRTRETAEVIDLLRHRTFAAVIGSSGSGKSSLVGAGVIPKLRANVIDGARDWAIVRCTPGELGAAPLAALAERAADQLGLAPLSAAPADATALIADLLANRPAWAKLLLFVDQFEELITVADEAPRQAVIALLEALAAHPSAKVIVTLRADFFSRIVALEPLARLFNEGTYALSAPGPGALYEMITRPAERAGLTYEDGLPDRILKDTGTDPGALALMAFALDQLYADSTAEAGRRALTHAAYERIGRVQGAIALRADETFAALDAASRAALPRVFQELITIDDRGVPTRSRALLRHFDQDAPARALIARFTERRLLMVGLGAGGGITGAATLEVAHEALFRGWSRLVAWIDEAAGDLRLQQAARRAADEWEAHGRSPEYLWSASRNAEVAAMIARREWKPGPLVLAFIRSETERLLDELASPATPAERRAEIGLTLAVLGDPRPGVGVLPDGTPDIAWVEVITAQGAFKAASYPVTIAQYRAYERETNRFQLGTPDGQRFDLPARPGVEPAFLSKFSDAASLRNQPATGLTWDEAARFCAWLAKKTGLPIRLPTVSERAAIEGRIDVRRATDIPANTLSVAANGAVAGLNALAAVGLFPADADGLFDLRGNVREWGQEAVAPQRMARTGPPSVDLRPLFGASFARLAGSTSTAVCAAHDVHSPEWGFRVVASALPVPEAPPAVPAPAAPTVAPITYAQRTTMDELWALLPRLRFPPLNPDYRLIPTDALDVLLADARTQTRAAILDDIDFCARELMPLFNQRDYQAAFHQNRYRLARLGVAALVTVVVISGSLTLWFAFTNRALPAIITLIGTVVALLVIYAVTLAGRTPAYPEYIENRRKAEFLRREYFRFLARLAPYSGTGTDHAHRQEAARRAADLNLGNEPLSASGTPISGGPAYRRFERERDEAMWRLLRRFLYDNASVYYKTKIDRYRRVNSLCNRFGAFSNVMAGIYIAAAGVITVVRQVFSLDLPGLAGVCGGPVCDILALLVPLLIIASLFSAASALLFGILPLIYQWERLIVIFETSLDNLDQVDAEPDDTLPDAAFRSQFEAFIEAALRVLETEAAQYGQARQGGPVGPPSPARVVR